MYKLRHGRQVVKLYFPKYIDKVVIITLVILEVEDITRKWTFGHITKKGGDYNDTPSPALHFSNLNNVWTFEQIKYV
jgi:hypothetical protein